MDAPMLDGKDIDQDRNEGGKGKSDGTTIQEAKELIVHLFVFEQRMNDKNTKVY